MKAGYTITIHQADAEIIRKEVKPKNGAVVLDADVHEYFPDSDSVNRALRCLIPLLPQTRKAKTKKT